MTMEKFLSSRLLRFRKIQQQQKNYKIFHKKRGKKKLWKKKLIWIKNHDFCQLQKTALKILIIHMVGFTTLIFVANSSYFCNLKKAQNILDYCFHFCFLKFLNLAKSFHFFFFTQKKIWIKAWLFSFDFQDTIWRSKLKKPSFWSFRL